MASQVWERGCRHGRFARNPAVAAEPGYELSQSAALGFLIWERNQNHHGQSLGESLHASKGQADAGFGAEREQVRPGEWGQFLRRPTVPFNPLLPFLCYPGFARAAEEQYSHRR